MKMPLNTRAAWLKPSRVEEGTQKKPAQAPAHSRNLGSSAGGGWIELAGWNAYSKGMQLGAGAELRMAGGGSAHAPSSGGCPAVPT